MEDFQRATQFTITQLEDFQNHLQEIAAIVQEAERESQMTTETTTEPVATPTFEQQMTTANVYAVTENGRGFLPPIMRAYGHILYLAGRQAESPTRKPTDDEVQNEFTHGLMHLSEANVTNVSDTSRTKLEQAITAWTTAQREVTGWEPVVRETNFVKLANFLMSVMTKLDRELLGIRDSDIGATP